MIRGKFTNRLLQFIIAYCLFSILQPNILVASGQELLKPVNDEYLYKEKQNNTPFPGNAVDFPVLQAPPEGEEDPEIIGIDEAPVIDALPYLFVLCGIYFLVIQKKRKRSSR